ncbi:hypothetical protein JCM14036_07440 [Desulfotomaculum defluvii]
MDKVNLKIAFIVLCYRETKDVINLIKNINSYNGENKIVIVNSYYDEKTKLAFENIAKAYNCDFLNVENKGYGYGNNRGIEFVNDKYNYEFLCICNPDIIFNTSPIKLLTEDLHGSIIAPTIKTKNGKMQNPYYYLHLPVVDWLKYVGLVKNKRTFYLFGVGINKIVRTIFGMLNFKKRTKIYACHGSCLFIGYKAVDKLGAIYNEDMFLFHEEEHLARKARWISIPTLLIKDIKVLHFEDGSSESIKDSTLQYMQQSYSVYYKSWNGET